MYYFTADTHFRHNNIISYCSRPFDSIQEMDETILNNINEKVKSTDTLFILGDFAFGHELRYLDRIKSNVVLINGSHDRLKSYVGSKYRLHDTYKLEVDNKLIFMSHYCHRAWPMSHYGSIHLFGHSHGNLRTNNLSMDVGVDTNACRPYSLDDIFVLMNKRADRMKIEGRVIFKDGKVFYIQDDSDYLKRGLAN